MTAAFVLGINMFVVGTFAVAFAVVAATNRDAVGAKWVALGYSAGILNVALEYLLPWQSDPMPIAIAIYLTYLLAMTLCTIGIARHYRVAPPAAAITLVCTLAILAIPLTFTLPYGTPLRITLYQLPYFAMQMVALTAVVRRGRLRRLDMLFVLLMLAAALIYLAKPVIAWKVGTATSPQGYMDTTYAAISQSLGSGTVVALALVLLLIMMRDMAAEILATSETDPLSGVYNRRGFTTHAERRLIAAHNAGSPAALVVADLDHFKRINDNYGHAAGDQAIAHFAQMLRQFAPEKAVVARPGGEEFAVLLDQCDLAEARSYAERVRRDFAENAADTLGLGQRLTASFGIAVAAPGDDLADLWRRADTAMYRAKAGGRDRLCVALHEMPPPVTPSATASGSRQR